jgi:hypothetical protein
MSNLYIFGCSYSAEFKKSGITEEYFKFKNGWPKSWSNLLNEKLGMNLVNTAKGGNGNDQIFDDFCIQSDKIKKDDIVIIGWSYINRFRLPDGSDNKKWINLSPVSSNLNVSKRTIEEISINRVSELYEDEIHNRENLIKSYSKSKNFKVYFWNAGFPFQKQDGYLLECFRKRKEDTFIDFVMNRGGLRIIEETKGEIDDNHLSENGHVIQFELFYDKIKKIL